MMVLLFFGLQLILGLKLLFNLVLVLLLALDISGAVSHPEELLCSKKRSCSTKKKKRASSCVDGLSIRIYYRLC